MTLLELRQQFIKESGFFDLATTVKEVHDTDAGADFFINSGIRFLDLLQETNLAYADYEVEFAIGDYSIQLEMVRVLKELWTVDSEGTWTQLAFKDFAWLLTNYPLLGGETVGEATYWGPKITRVSPDVTASAEPEPSSLTILIMPPTDEAKTIHIFGTFATKTLVNNTDSNYWTIRHPDLCVLAAKRERATSKGFADKATFYENQILKKLIGVDKDLADFESIGSLEMGEEYER